MEKAKQNKRICCWSCSKDILSLRTPVEYGSTCVVRYLLGLIKKEEQDTFEN